MSMLLVYFFVMMDALNTGLSLLTLVAVIGVVVSAIRSDTSNVEDRRRAKKWIKICIVAFLFIGSVTVLTPNTKQFAAIYVIPKIANSEDVRAISGDAIKLIRLKFGEYLDSIDPVEEVVKAVKPRE